VSSRNGQNRSRSISNVFGFKEKTMIGAVKIQVKPEEIIEAVKGMEKRKRDAFLEDLLAATSPEYLKSIWEARADYRAKRVKTHGEVFG
jgi:hypothetical protein